MRASTLGICFWTGLAVGFGAVASPAQAQQDAATPLHLSFTRPAIQSVIQGPPPGARTPGFNIIVNFPDASLTASQQAAFTAASTFWETRITGYTGTITVASVTINATAPAIDGTGGILGQAGPTIVSIQSGFVLPTQGIMMFDTADVGNLEAAGELGEVIRHEMAHVLGLGTLWSCNPHPNTANGCGLGGGTLTPLYTPGSGEFMGAGATARWGTEFSQTGTPDVELGGGAGTAGGHWNEVDGGAGFTGITDGSNDMRNELMTGWLNSPTFLSEMTLASFSDSGYTTGPTGGCTISPIALGTTNLGGSWTTDCESTHGPPIRYAKFYDFTLATSTEVRIDLTSTVDTYLYLLQGSSTNGAVIEADDDDGAGTNSQIVRMLAPGTYTIEATTFPPMTTGSFTLGLADNNQTGGSCVEDLQNGTVCLRSGRFEVSMTWTDFAGLQQPVIFTMQTQEVADAAFQNNPNDVTVTVKVTNGCPVNGNFWVWIGAFTQAGFTVTVTDLQMGTFNSYVKAVGGVYTTLRDTVTFPCL